MSEACFKSIAWSNVFKVGALKSEGGNNQGEEPVTRKRVSEGIRKEKAGGPGTMYGKPFDLGKFMRGRKEREKK